MKGYKAYDHGLICREKHYEVGQTYEEPKAEICECGMHYCDNPADLMYYHDLIDENGEIMEITEVEDLSPEATQSQVNGCFKKYCTTKLKIGAKICFGEWIKATIVFLMGKTKGRTERVSDESFARLASAGGYSRLASARYYSQLASSGDFSYLVSSGDSSRLASSGYYSRLASAGYYSQLASSGDFSYLVSSGDSSQLASSGCCSRLASAGNGSQLASSGYCSRLASSGNGSQLASSGDCSRLASSGNSSRLVSAGEDSVICIAGIDGMAKAAKGCWITLAEWDYSTDKGRYIPVCVKTEQVDGKRIKADTWYQLRGGEFVEAESRTDG